MFCPNCGTQNAESTIACTKCGFKLKGASAPKFAGTMLMMNAAQIPGMTPGAPAQPAQPAAPTPEPQAKKPAFKSTMLIAGAAPPPAAPVAPSPSPMRAPDAGATPLAAAPIAGAPMDMGAQQPMMGAPQAGFGAPPAGMGAPQGVAPVGFGAPAAGMGAPPAGAPVGFILYVIAIFINIRPKQIYLYLIKIIMLLVDRPKPF